MALFRRSLRATLTRQLVVISVKGGGGYRGILWDDDHTGAKLVGPAGKKISFIQPEGPEVPVSGWVFIPANEIEVFQVVTPD